ncbi:hypothetical protein CARUB_v10017958mg [Capsella rubella]|uniref:Uncharacterized protein n=1 Tax=Capsella rubella TaxID=81985 RepID=R0FR58_9BRAS|nr:hypothetical protein CARUB_v10017958mg [Capsella rubella]
MCLFIKGKIASSSSKRGRKRRSEYTGDDDAPRKRIERESKRRREAEVNEIPNNDVLDEIQYEHAPAFANGWLYWFSKEKTNLVAFDLHKEVFEIVPNPIIEVSSSSVDMFMESVDDDSRLVLMSETDGDGMQHVWRLTNHNTGGTLSIMDKMFSFDLNKITSTWFGSHYSSILKLMALSKKTGDTMLSRPHSRSFPLSEPLNFSTFIHNCIIPKSPPPRIDSGLLPYFPSFISPF